MLEFEDGALGVIDNARSAGYGFECSAELVGARSTLRIGAGHRASGVERLTPDGLTACLAADHIERHAPAYLDELIAFVDAVRTVALPARAAPTRWPRWSSPWPRSARTRSAVPSAVTERTAVITGATSGIGLACAQRFAEAGWDLVLVGRRSSPPRPGAVAIRGDVALAETSRRGVDLALDRFGRLDAVVGNAGVTLAKTIDETTEDELEHLIAVNLKALVFLAQAAHGPLRDAAGRLSSSPRTRASSPSADPRSTWPRRAPRSSWRGRSRSTGRPRASASTRSAPASSTRRC